ncbi:hypothetical protein HO133_004838 [Letharia lupina]|uniref:Uncharacterized protein n=1 Tax=Letharia lupina TaxID=560253 RepID=A0A8H6FL39_9LECA|nr:uncharacterized protein HO133_004838 [Letharia lupina]KAF6230494.1 hypothetical protein HO133_004838 [Letharia lupina]
MPAILQLGSMAKQPFADAATEFAQPSVQSPSVGNQQLPEAKPEETPPSNIKKLVRKLTKRVKPSKEKGASLPAENESAEDKLVGFISRNPQLFVPAEEERKQASLQIPEIVVRARTLSRSQRQLERLENPLILDATPVEEADEQEKAKETMRQSRTARFRKRLEEYL